MPHDTATQRHHEYDVYCEHSIYSEQCLMTQLHKDTMNMMCSEHSIYSEQCLMTQLHKDTMNMMCIVNIVSIVNNAS